MRLRDFASWDKGYMHMGLLGEGYGTVSVGEGVREGLWDKGYMHMGLLGEGYGTVSVGEGVWEGLWGKKRE
nr:hypothetical protein [Tanacetum cinerariifolium]